MFELYYSNCPVPSAFVVAIRAFEKEFAARGVRFSVLPSEHSTTHFSGDLPAYFRFGGEIPPLVTQGLRAPGTTRLIGLTPLRGIQGYFVRADSGLKSPADLKGKRVGIAYNARHLVNALGDVDYLGLHPWDQTMCALGTWELRALLHTLALGGLRLTLKVNLYLKVSRGGSAVSDLEVGFYDHSDFARQFHAQLQRQCGPLARALCNTDDQPRPAPVGVANPQRIGMA